MLNLVRESQDRHVTYSHDCWGSGTSDEHYTLNIDKLAENTAKSCLGIINNRLAGCTLEQREILHLLRQDVLDHFDVVL